MNVISVATPVSHSSIKFPSVPAAFFGMVLGLAGLGNAWPADLSEQDK